MTHSSNRERAAAQKSHADFLAAYGLTELDVPMVVLDLTDAPDATDAYATQRSNPPGSPSPADATHGAPTPGPMHPACNPMHPACNPIIQPATLCIQRTPGSNPGLASLRPYLLNARVRPLPWTGPLCSRTTGSARNGAPTPASRGTPSSTRSWSATCPSRLCGALARADGVITR
jgi:hypothetical protein